MASTSGEVRPPEHRVDQPCHSCGKWDKDPRHHHLAADPAGGFVDRIMHIDCCAGEGCPDGSCNVIMEQSNQAHGEDLIRHVTTVPFPTSTTEA
jgi:hypothetical protein